MNRPRPALVGVGLLPALALLALGSAAQGQEPPPLPWGVSVDDAIPITLPPALRSRIDIGLIDLEYEDTSTVRGFVADFDGDGIQDYLIRSAPSLCGTGGCPYDLFDGITGKELGQFFGNPLYVHAHRANGFPIIDTYGHSSAASGTFTTYAFDGSVYVVTSSRTLMGVAVDSLFKAMKGIPMWRPNH
jgi:hypothetical protein